jgi:hypothetical protein
MKIKRFDFKFGSSGFDLYCEEHGEYIKFKELQNFVNQKLNLIQHVDPIPNTGHLVPNHNNALTALKDFFKVENVERLKVEKLQIEAKKLGFKLVKNLEYEK